VDKLTSKYFEGMESGITKRAAGVAQMVEAAAPKAEGLAAKLVGALRRNPVLATATAAAAGAGVATGVADAGAKKKEEERRREQIRQLLMSRLSEGGLSQ
jgi:hypothetical protein